MGVAAGQVDEWRGHGVTDHGGRAALNAAIKRPVDRLAVGQHEVARPARRDIDGDRARLVRHAQADLGLKYSVAPERGTLAHLSALAPVQALMRPDHPLATRAKVRMAEVVRYPLVLPTTGNTGRDLFDLSCSLQGLHYQVRVESNFASALLSQVVGRDVLLAGRLTVAHLLARGEMVTVPFAEGELQQRRLQLITAEDTRPSPMVMAFIDAIKSAIAQEAT